VAEHFIGVNVEHHRDAVPAFHQCARKALDANGVAAEAVGRIEGGQHAEAQPAHKYPPEVRRAPVFSVLADIIVGRLPCSPGFSQIILDPCMVVRYVIEFTHYF
jgi:hypothetical protein